MSKPKWYVPFWVTYRGSPPGCVEAVDDAEASRLAAELAGEPALSVARLPYPALPRLNPATQPHGGTTPSFCFRPSQCQGSTACPQRLSCVE